MSWLEIREKLVEQALQDGDIPALREISALPGGFGSNELRQRVWPVLLNVEHFSANPGSSKPDEQKSHPDEAQVKLDVNRSFISYPRGQDREALRQRLESLILVVLRGHPTLSYFQGYHDIMSVLLLTLDDARKCAEVVSVCRIRDAMGSSLNPLMGMLKLLNRLLHVATPDISRFAAQISPEPSLPFFALSWLLCLFSHDIERLEPTQRVFDYLLARNPIIVVYLAVAIVIEKTPQMIQLASELEYEEDPTLLHPLFSRLPPLEPDEPDSQTPQPTPGNPYNPIRLSVVFAHADELMAKHPWDGPDLRGREIFGEGSVVLSYDRELDMTLEEEEACLKKPIALPGATEPDQPASIPVAKPRQGRRLGLTLAVGVLILGLALASYPPRGHFWQRWWTAFVQRSALRRIFDLTFR